jgi:hypothetical protein
MFVLLAMAQLTKLIFPLKWPTGRSGDTHDNMKLEAISQIPAAAGRKRKASQKAWKGKEILEIETAGLWACYGVVRRSQPHCGDAPSSRLVSGPNPQPRHLRLFLRGLLSSVRFGNREFAGRLAAGAIALFIGAAAQASPFSSNSPANTNVIIASGALFGPFLPVPMPPALDTKHLFALGMIETGNNDSEIGAAGEVSRYQIHPIVWKAYSRRGDYWNTSVAVEVAQRHWTWLTAYFVEKAGRQPTDFDMYVLWNTKFGYYAGKGFNPNRLAAKVRDRAQRFVNLLNRKG